MIMLKTRSPNDAICPKCNGKDIVRNGIRRTGKGINQKFKCRSCSYRFVMEHHDLRYENDLINYAKLLRNSGFTFQQIKDDILENHGIKVQRSTIFRWTVEKMESKEWIGKCLDCSFEISGSKTYIQSKGSNHELEYPGHWVEQSEKK